MREWIVKCFNRFCLRSLSEPSFVRAESFYEVYLRSPALTTLNNGVHFVSHGAAVHKQIISYSVSLFSRCSSFIAVVACWIILFNFDRCFSLYHYIFKLLLKVKSSTISRPHTLNFYINEAKVSRKRREKNKV